MADKHKTFLAFFIFLGALILPLFGLMIGWRKWDATTGIILMAAIFVIMIVLGSLVLLRVKDLSWFSVYMPYIIGTVYGFLPDSIPFSVDDAAATTAGAIFSFTLAMKKNLGPQNGSLSPYWQPGCMRYWVVLFLVQ